MGGAFHLQKGIRDIHGQNQAYYQQYRQCRKWLPCEQAPQHHRKMIIEHRFGCAEPLF